MDVDAARALVAKRNLTPAAVGALTDIVKALPFEALGPVKQLLKQFFSDQPWTEHDGDSLAGIIGDGSGSQQLALDPDLTLTWGWNDGRFFLRVDGPAGIEPGRAVASATDLGLTFESDVFPEVTPSPRTIRFATPPLHSGPSRVYRSIADAAGDPRVTRVFAEFDAVTNMLIGPDFVAITIAHADQWDALLAPILRVVSEEFTSGAVAPSEPASADPPRSTVAHSVDAREPRRLERAWADLAALRAHRPDDLDRILTASRDTEPARRQVAAALLADAPAEAAADAWQRLSGDDSRAVRRSTIDAVVDAGRESLRPLLERALTDPDAWIRWKAVHGIAALGTALSRAAIEACAADADFRVRLEAARALG